MEYVVVFCIGVFFGIIVAARIKMSDISNTIDEAYKTGYNVGIEEGKEIASNVVLNQNK